MTERSQTCCGEVRASGIGPEHRIIDYWRCSKDNIGGGAEDAFSEEEYEVRRERYVLRRQFGSQQEQSSNRYSRTQNENEDRCKRCIVRTVNGYKGQSAGSKYSNETDRMRSVRIISSVKGETVLKERRCKETVGESGRAWVQPKGVSKVSADSETHEGRRQHLQKR